LTPALELDGEALLLSPLHRSGYVRFSKNYAELTSIAKSIGQNVDLENLFVYKSLITVNSLVHSCFITNSALSKIILWTRRKMILIYSKMDDSITH
jgi:hypothetical protein